MVGMATIIAFHAHPDDEVLLTGGTLARLAAEGNRVVIVMACVGGLGHAPSAGAGRRFEELRESASRLGVARVLDLGYADSGHGPVLFPDPPDRVRFARADLDEAAAKLAGLIREEHADVLLSYDPQGGVGHRDHVKVHEVGARAAQMAGSVRVLEATFPRELAAWAFGPLRLLRLVVRYDPPDIRMGFSPRSAITHRVNVRRYARQKRAALAAHRSQIGPAGRASRLFWVVVRLPVPVFGLLFGREWFAEPGTAITTICGDILSEADPGAVSVKG
jgi:LmbE family N-acetylglucosaminyl deacetylase